MKKIFLGLLSMFVLIGMSWAGVKVSGKIAVTDQTPVAGNTIVKLRPASGDDILPAENGVKSSATEAGKLEYEFLNVAEGTYSLVVEGRVDALYFDTITKNVTVGATDDVVKDVTATVSKTKFYYEVRVQDASYGSSIAGASVKVWAATGTEPEQAMATSGTDGSAYVLMTAAEGAHKVKAEKTGFKTKTIEVDKICYMAEGSSTEYATVSSTGIQLAPDYGNVVDLYVVLKDGSTKLTALPEGVNTFTVKAAAQPNAIYSQLVQDTFKFSGVAVGNVEFAFGSGDMSYGLKNAPTSIAGEDGAKVTMEMEVERTAGILKGKVADGANNVYAFSVEATKAGKTISACGQMDGTYTIYGLTTGTWSVVAKPSTAAAFETVAAVNVEIAAATDDKTQNFTLTTKELEITFHGNARDYNTTTYQTTYLTGATVQIWKKGATENTKLGEVTITDNYGSFEVKGNAKFGDSVICKIDDSRYEPREFKGFVNCDNYSFSIPSDGWVARTAPVTQPALKVTNPAAAWETGGVKLTWDYPAALINGTAWADGYKIQKVTIYKADLTASGTATELASWPQSAQNELTVETLPREYKDAAAKEDGYYSYRFELRYETPADTKDTTIVYGTAPASLQKVMITNAVWDATTYANKPGVKLTWDYPSALKEGLGTTYKLRNLQIARRDLATASTLVTVKAYDFVTVGDDANHTVTYMTDATQLPKEFVDTVSGVKRDGNYSYQFILNYAQPAGTTTEVIYLDMTPKGPVNAVAEWKTTPNKRVELTWGYPASLQANWATMKPQRFQIERRNGNSATEMNTVFYKNVDNDDTFDSLPTEWTDTQVEESGNYTYVLSLRYADLGTITVTVTPSVRAHTVIDFDAQWIAAGENGKGVQLSWNYPAGLIQGLGTTYKMQLMTIERRNLASATERTTLMVWGKEQLQSAAALPKAHFDATAAEDGNYNYIITIRYEEPAATVETVKNLNMALYAVTDVVANKTNAVVTDTTAQIRLTWAYPEAIRSGLGSTYKLRKLDIHRRDLSTAYEMPLVKYFEFAEGVTFSDMVKEYKDTVKNNGNYAYVFTLYYSQPAGMRTTTVKIDLREEVTLAYSVSDATLGEITGSPASRAATTDLAAIKYYKGDLVSLKAQVKEGVENARFVAWKKGTAVVSTEAEYSFVIVENTTLVAEFAGNTTPTVRPLALDKPAAAWNAGTKRVDLTWDYPQAVKDGLGTDYKIQKIDLLRNDNALGGTSQVMVGYFNSFTTVENLPKSWYDTTAEAGKTYTYIFRIRYVDLGEKDTTAQVTIPVAVEVNELAATRIYPNPANGEFNVFVPVAAKMEIFAANGVLVKAEKVAANRKVAIRESGIYFVRLTTASGAVLVKRVVVR